MKRKLFIISILTWMLVFLMTACSTLFLTETLQPKSNAPPIPEASVPATTEPPAPSPAEIPGHIVIEPRFTLDTVPECGNVNTYLNLLYEPGDNVLEALSLPAMDGAPWYWLPQRETLFGHEFSAYLTFDHTSNNLFRITYYLKLPNETAEEEAAELLSSVIDLYGNPDVRYLHVEFPESVKRWTLDKHHEAASIFASLDSRLAHSSFDGIGVFLEYRLEESLLVSREEDQDDADVMYLSLTYELAPYYTLILKPGDEGWPY